MAVAELHSIIRTDSALRAAAWAEIKYRNQAKQAFEAANGRAVHELIDRKITSLQKSLEENWKIKPWAAPDLTPGA